MTTSQLYLLGAIDRRDVTVQQQQSLPPLDFAWLDSYLEEYHTPPGAYSADGTGSETAVSHADQMRIYRNDYEQELYVPFNNGIIAYDVAGVAIQGYHYFQARGNPPDQRWLDFATNSGRFWHLASDRYQYGAFTGVMHFPQGLWLCGNDNAGLTPEEFTADARKLIPTMYGNIYYQGAPSNERLARESARLMEWFSLLYRNIGMDDPQYKTSDNVFGRRYHAGQDSQKKHIWEWLHEWKDDPLYPAPPGQPYTGPLDYSHRALDPLDDAGIAIKNFGPFINQFCYQSNMMLWNEDANYKTADRVQRVKEIVDFNYANGWFPATNNPGDAEQFGAYGYYYNLCAEDDGIRIQTVECGSPPNNFWGPRLYASKELSGFHLEAIAWLWRHTGDMKYIAWFDELWRAMAAMYYSGYFNFAMRSAFSGKQANQFVLRIFNAIVLRGDLNFKTTMYPAGWPYQTPPRVDPSS